MNETEQLKKNTEEQHTVQRLTEISKYLDEVFADLDKAIYWCRRANILVDFTFISYLILLVLGIWLDASKITMDIATNFHYFVLIVAIARDWHLNRQRAWASGELKGALKILELLGMIPPPRNRGDREKKRIWAEGLNLVKSWFVKKQKMQEKVYAPA